MKRPYKKKITHSSVYDDYREEGFNQCVDAFDEYLPSQEEIMDIIEIEMCKDGIIQKSLFPRLKKISKAMSKRINNG